MLRAKAESEGGRDERRLADLLRLASCILTPENVESVIASLIGKTTREAEEVKVRFAPKVDVKDMIRKLPSAALPPSVVPVPPSMAAGGAMPAETAARRFLSSHRHRWR